MSKIRLALVEDDKMIRDSLETFLNNQPEIEVLATAGSVEEFLLLINSTSLPELILLDIGLPGVSGIEGIAAIRNRCPETDIMMLTASDDSNHVFQALCNGAISYLSKRSTLSNIKEAILTIFKGGSYMSPSIARQVINFFRTKQSNIQPDYNLTSRQKEIIEGLMDGLSYKLIGEKLDISIETVRDHIKKIYKKLAVNSRNEIVHIMMERKSLD
jgi:DNA-binding NarL/FixJ family response regulator